MSHVAFLSAQDGSTVVSEPGSPFASWGGGVSPYIIGEAYPIKLTLAQRIKFWWKVKNWTLETDVAVTDSLGNTYAIPNGALVIGGANPVDELGLIRADASYSFLASTNLPPCSLNLTWITGSLGNTPAPLLRSGADLYPLLTLDGQVGDGALQNCPFGFYGHTSFFMGSIDGLPIPFSYDPAAVSSFFGTKFKLTPLTLWPYV